MRCTLNTLKQSVFNVASYFFRRKNKNRITGHPASRYRHQPNTLTYTADCRRPRSDWSTLTSSIYIKRECRPIKQQTTTPTYRNLVQKNDLNTNFARIKYRHPPYWPHVRTTTVTFSYISKLLREHCLFFNNIASAYTYTAMWEHVCPYRVTSWLTQMSSLLEDP